MRARSWNLSAALPQHSWPPALSTPAAGPVHRVLPEPRGSQRATRPTGHQHTSAASPPRPCVPGASPICRKLSARRPRGYGGGPPAAAHEGPARQQTLEPVGVGSPEPIKKPCVTEKHRKGPGNHLGEPAPPACRRQPRPPDARPTQESQRRQPRVPHTRACSQAECRPCLGAGTHLTGRRA